MSINGFQLDARLANDTIALGRLDGIHLLLFDNALIPWFILVPETDCTELYQLQPEERDRVHQTSHELSLFIKAHYPVDKINIGAIGNIVRQLHIHVVGRREDDYCWPQVVWGTQQKRAYRNEEINEIGNNLKSHFGHRITDGHHEH